MSPNIDSFPNIQYKFLNSNSYLYDLVYNPKQTKFLSKGKKNNSYTKNGLEMLETHVDTLLIPPLPSSCRARKYNERVSYRTM